MELFLGFVVVFLFIPCIPLLKTPYKVFDDDELYVTFKQTSHRLCTTVSHGIQGIVNASPE